MTNKCVRLGVVGVAAMAALAGMSPAAATVGTSAPTALPEQGLSPGTVPTVLPIAGIPGSTVTVRGDDCGDGGPGWMAKVTIGDGVVPTDPTPVGPDGTWSVTAKVPASAAPGRYEVNALCGSAQGSTAYAPAYYFVEPVGGGKSVEVSSTTVKPGSELTVRGAGCLVDGKAGRVDVFTVFQGLDEQRITSGHAAADGSWKITVDVPADAKPGRAPVGAHCFGLPKGAPIAHFYAPAIVEVTDGKAPTPVPTTKGKSGKGPKAVKVSPRYTG